MFYLFALLKPFFMSVYFPEGKRLVESELIPSIFAKVVLACSTLNVFSHSAVVLGWLNETVVLSILIGVTFDVSSIFFYVGMWGYISGRIFSNDYKVVQQKLWASSIFVTIYFLSTTYHLIIHVRAMRMSHSFHRMKSVVQSALNNIKGEPGNAYIDHLFAYTDLGAHLSQLLASFIFLGPSRAFATELITLILLALIYAIHVHVSNITKRSNIWFDEISIKDRKNTITYRNGEIVCLCNTCQRNKNFAALNISFRDKSLCNLWFCTFSELLSKLSSVQDEKETK